MFNTLNLYTEIMRITSLLSVIGLYTALLVQNFAAATPQQNTANEETLRSTFTTSGLTNSALITKIFEGDFVNIDLDRTDDRFGILFQQYLEAFAQHCSSALPRDKVEMTNQRCAHESDWVTRNGYGIEISRTRTCDQYETFGIGLFAKPALYNARNSVTRQRAADMGRELSRAFGVYTQPDAIPNVVRLIGDAQAISNDMHSLVQINACKAPGLLRFEDNLSLFALNKQPLRLGGGTATASVIDPGRGQSFKDQNYRKLVEDLILDDAKQWGAFARYIDGSVTGASVGERDPQGRPKSVIVPYRWEGMMGRVSSQATLTFSDGQPECLTYAETPNVCHSPNRRIVARYLEGGYAN